MGGLPTGSDGLECAGRESSEGLDVEDTREDELSSGDDNERACAAQGPGLIERESEADCSSEGRARVSGVDSRVEGLLDGRDGVESVVRGFNG